MDAQRASIDASISTPSPTMMRNVPDWLKRPSPGATEPSPNGRGLAEVIRRVIKMRKEEKAAAEDLEEGGQIRSSQTLKPETNEATCTHTETVGCERDLESAHTPRPTRTVRDL